MKRVTPAEKRTLSLFTGNTDLEDGNSRDGSKPLERHTRQRHRAVAWKASGIHLHLSSEGEKCATDGGEWVAFSATGIVVGRYSRLIDAVAALDERRGWR